jgi:hypothetical protein
VHKINLFLLLTFFAGPARAQFAKSVELKPIQVQGSRYFYDFKHVNSGFSLQIPLQSLDDAEINKRYNNYRILREFGAAVYLVPIIYLFSATYASSNTGTSSYNDAQTFSILVWSAVAVNIGCNIASNIQLKKGILRYNMLIFKNNGMGLQLERIPNHQPLLGIGFSRRF